MLDALIPLVSVKLVVLPEAVPIVTNAPPDPEARWMIYDVGVPWS